LSVKTKSIYEPAKPEDGVRVLIARYYPRGVKKDRFDRWMKQLSPSRELLAAYRDGAKGWDEFKESFVMEMKASPESLEALQELYLIGQARDVTLLCYEKEGLPCHRHVVRGILSSRVSLSEILGADVRGRKSKARSPRLAPEHPRHS